jgi:hypothetical protein
MFSMAVSEGYLAANPFLSREHHPQGKTFLLREYTKIGGLLIVIEFRFITPPLPCSGACFKPPSTVVAVGIYARADQPLH